jgi:hypothetical protein
MSHLESDTAGEPDSSGKVLIGLLVAAFGCSHGFFVCGAVLLPQAAGPRHTQRESMLPQAAVKGSPAVSKV